MVGSRCLRFFCASSFTLLLLCSVCSLKREKRKYEGVNVFIKNLLVKYVDSRITLKCRHPPIFLDTLGS